MADTLDKDVLIAKQDKEIKKLKADLEFLRRHMENRNMCDPRMTGNLEEASIVSELSRHEVNDANASSQTSMNAGLTDECKNLYEGQIAELKSSLQDEKEKSAKLIKMVQILRKLVPADADMSNPQPLDREVWISRLYTDLEEIDKEWKAHYPIMVQIIESFIQGRSIQLEELVQNVEQNLKAITKDVNDISSFANLTNINLESNAAANISLDQSMAYYDVYALYKSVCKPLFDRLKATAEFLRNLIVSLERSEDPEVKKIVEQIRALRLGLNTSLNEASAVFDDVEKVEQSLSTALEMSVRYSTVHPSTEGMKEELSLKNQEIEARGQKIHELEHCIHEKQIALSDAENAKLDALEDIEKLHARIQEIQFEKEDLEEQLKKVTRETNQSKKQEVANLKEKLSELEFCINEKEVALLNAQKANADAINSIEELNRRVQEIQSEKENVQQQLRATAAIMEEKDAPVREAIPSIVEEMSRIYSVLHDANKVLSALPKPRRGSKSKAPTTK